MKQIIETKMVEQTTIRFVAKDGREFQGDNAERKCEEYERRLDVEKCKKEFNKLNPTYFEIPLVNWVGCECNTYVVTLNSEKDYDVLTDYYVTMPYVEFDAGYYKPKAFPATVVVIEEDIYISIYNHSVSEIIGQMRTARKILDDFV